jgi:hypothetical protein
LLLAAFKVSRIIHWITVALVCGLLVTALFGGIDPHGAGNTAFLWHSSMGLALLEWAADRPKSLAPHRHANGDAARREAAGQSWCDRDTTAAESVSAQTEKLVDRTNKPRPVLDPRAASLDAKETRTAADRRGAQSHLFILL